MTALNDEQKAMMRDISVRYHVPKLNVAEGQIAFDIGYLLGLIALLVEKIEKPNE